MSVTGKVRVSLTLENILNKISEYDIYRFYLGHDFKLGKAFSSPFHKDTTPSFSVSVTKRGVLHHMDFADSERRGNCVELVKQLYNLEYREALVKIDRDFGLGIYSGEVKDYKSIIDGYKRPEIEESPAHIIVESRWFESEELAYWRRYHVTPDMLKENKVYGVKRLFINRTLFPIPIGELVFAYKFEDNGDKWKIYRPYAPKEYKWRMNVSNNVMSGLHRITPGCGNVVVTKAKKDEMVLSTFLPHVCSVQSESTSAISTENIKLLQSNCKKIYLNFDSDEVGVQNCKYYNQYGFSWVNCPKGFKKPNGEIIKDFADLAKFYGLQTVIDHFKQKGII